MYGRPAPRRAVLAAFAVGWLLQMVQVVMVDDYTWVGQHSAQFGAGVVVWLFATWPKSRMFVRVVVLAVAICLPMAYIAHLLGVLPGPSIPPGQRSGLWFVNPNLLGIAIVSSTALASLLITRARWLTVPLWVLAGTITVAMLSRAALVAAILGLSSWGWTRFRGVSRVWFMVSAAALVLLAGVFVAHGPEPISETFGPQTRERFTGGSVADPAGSGGVFARLRANGAALQLISLSWPWGVGAHRFGDAYLAAIAPEAPHALGHAHNQVLNLLAEGGVFGLLAWTLPLCVALWGLGRRAWWFLVPMVVVQAVFWISESPFLFAGAFYATWVALGAARQVAVGSWDPGHTASSSLEAVLERGGGERESRFQPDPGV